MVRIIDLLTLVATGAIGATVLYVVHLRRTARPRLPADEAAARLGARLRLEDQLHPGLLAWLQGPDGRAAWSAATLRPSRAGLEPVVAALTAAYDRAVWEASAGER